MWRLGGLLALLAATTKAQEGVPRPTRLRIYEVRTALLTEDDGTSSPTILNQGDAIRFLERARSRR